MVSASGTGCVSDGSGRFGRHLQRVDEDTDDDGLEFLMSAARLSHDALVR